MNLYQVAEKENIRIDRMSIPLTVGIAVPGAICLDEDLTFDGPLERSVMAHELGHCLTDSFYHRSAPAFIRRRMENRADKWAVSNLVPKNELRNAILDGRTSIWDLAEYFNVTDDLIKKAICLYTTGNLELEYYGII